MLLFQRKKPSSTIKLHDRKRSWKLLLLAILSGSLLGLLIFFVPPETTYSLSIVQISVLPFFFLLLFTFVFAGVSYIFKSKIHGILAALLAITYLVFRQNSLTHPFFALLLLALFLVLELLFTYRK
jgi:hypothetical protein